MLPRRRKAPQPYPDPVVIASLTRSGSTLLQRILSTHPQLTIWGEHFGVLSHLRQAQETLDRARDQIDKGHAQRHRLIGSTGPIGALSPQVNPFDTALFEQAIRSFIVDTFTRGLPPGTRWGFKEVRYGIEDLEFLARLFPSMRLIVLVREPSAQISSLVRAPWRQYPEPSAPERSAALRTVVESAARGWTAGYDGFRRFIESGLVAHLTVRYEDLISGALQPDVLFAHCGLEPGDADIIQTMLDRPVFSSDNTPGWGPAERAELDALIDAVEFPEHHADVLDFYYPDRS